MKRIRLGRVIKRLHKYYEHAIARYHNKDNKSNEKKKEYCHGLSLGYRYALAQVQRKDITDTKKTELLFEYKYKVEDKDIKAACIFLGLKGSEVDKDELPVEASDYEGEKGEDFKAGFMSAMERSYRLFDDMMNYLSFLELLFSKR